MERENTTKLQITENSLRLPQDIIEEILSRLPVKSILKFRIIVNPERDIPLKLVCWRSLLNDPFAFDSVISVDRDVNIVGCCNGLVCILEDERFILWNPSTRMAMNVGNAGFGKVFAKYGFGYDESSDDYKVFVIITLSCRPDVYQAISRLYSLKTNSWKTLKYEQDSEYHFDGAGTFASGNLHWITDDQEIVSFDLKSELDGMVEQPNSLKGDIFPTLGVIDGCLSVLCDKDYQGTYFDVWVMKEYGVKKESWVKLVTLPNFRHNSISEDLVSFCRGPNGEILLIHPNTFVIYYPEGKAVHHPRINITDPSFEAGFYVESLVSVASNAEQEPEPLVFE
ncbi:hypothetical protein ACS0TY_000553 [Phlomoides rotata]